MSKPNNNLPSESFVPKLRRFLSRAAGFATGGMPLYLYLPLLGGAAVAAFAGLPFAGIALAGVAGLYAAAAAGAMVRRLRGPGQPLMPREADIPAVHPITSLPRPPKSAPAAKASFARALAGLCAKGLAVPPAALREERKPPTGTNPVP
jgi:hypothetical protein